MAIKCGVIATTDATSFLNALVSPSIAARRTRKQRCRDASSSAARVTNTSCGFIFDCNENACACEWTASVGMNAFMPALRVRKIRITVTNTRAHL